MKTIFIIGLRAAAIFAQEKLEAEKVKIEKPAAGFDNSHRVSPNAPRMPTIARFRQFYLTKHAQTKIFQSFTLDDQQAAVIYNLDNFVYLEDYNFDGFADLALRDGSNGGYGGPSYQIYLFSPKLKKFVNDPALTALNQEVYMGVMKVDRRRKVLRVNWKSGCCYHQEEEYKVVGNSPKKVFERAEEGDPISGKLKITVSRLVRGKWRETVRYK